MGIFVPFRTVSRTFRTVSAAPTSNVFGMLQIPMHSSLLEALREQYATPSLVQGFRIDGVSQLVTRTTFFVRETLPIVLAIGLNRFGFDSCKNVLTKDHTPCTIPSRLDMSSFCVNGTSSASSEIRAPTSTQPTLYDLSTISMHGGGNTGHNWTYIKVRVPMSTLLVLHGLSSMTQKYARGPRNMYSNELVVKIHNRRMCSCTIVWTKLKTLYDLLEKIRFKTRCIFNKC